MRIILTPQEWAQGLVADGFNVVDVETSGLLDNPKSEILSIAVVSSTGEVLANNFVSNLYRIDETSKSFEINGITQAILTQFGSSWPALWDFGDSGCGDGIYHILKPKPVVAWDADFDRKMIQRECKKSDIQCSGLMWNCAMLQYADYRGDKGKYGGYKSHSLATACQQMGIPHVGSHTPAGGTKAVIAIVHAMAKGQR